MAYRFLAVALRTGRVIGELPLVGVRAERRLTFGQFSAALKLPTAAPVGSAQRPLDLARCAALLDATSPAIVTVVVTRDDRIMGEWVLWSRDRSQRPVPLTGQEIGSWFYHAAVDGFTAMTQVDELLLARLLVENALAKPFAPPMLVEDPGLSGNLIPKAKYPSGSEYIGNILDELGGSIDGVDWWVDTEWDYDLELPTVKRTVRFAHPERGSELQARIDIPAGTNGFTRSGVDLGLTEDGTKVATTVYMTGNTDRGRLLVSRGRNSDLYVSYPDLDYIDSRSSYSEQVLLDASAGAVAAATRTPVQPVRVTLRADGDLQLGTYAPGDTVPAVMEPWENFPDGLQTTVRILGYAVTPPDAGATDMVEVEIEAGDASVFDT